MPLLLTGWLLAVTGAAVALPGEATRAEAVRAQRVEMAELIFHSRVVVRVRTAPLPSQPVREMWSEKKGPRCVPAGDIAGAAVLAPGSVDLVTRGGGRVRARFAASCPGLDYYSGFYIVPPRDAQICADRDVVRDRAGGECPIDKFRTLVPRK